MAFSYLRMTPTHHGSTELSSECNLEGSFPLIAVLHSVEVWLPLTQNWIYTQIRNLPANVTNYVSCESTLNLSEFGIKNIQDFAGQNFISSVYYRICRRLGHPKQFEKSLIKKNRIRLVHSHFGHVAWSNIELSSPPASCRHVATFYGFDFNFLPKEPIWKQRYLELFNSIDCILCEGPHMAMCLSKLGCPENKIAVHHLGVEVEQLRFAPRHWKSGTPLKVLIAASFVEKKGIPAALEALAKLQGQIELEITIIGDATPGPKSQHEKARILRTLNESNLINRTKLLGYVTSKQLYEEAYKSDLFLSPSITARSGDTEGGAPVTLIQMLAIGLPVISTTHCDIPNVILDGITGRLAPEGDGNALIQCLKDFISNRDDWQSYVHAARERVEKEFNARIQAKRLASIYEAVLNK